MNLLLLGLLGAVGISSISENKKHIATRIKHSVRKLIHLLSESDNDKLKIEKFNKMIEKLEKVRKARKVAIKLEVEELITAIKELKKEKGKVFEGDSEGLKKLENLEDIIKEKEELEADIEKQEEELKLLQSQLKKANTDEKEELREEIKEVKQEIEKKEKAIEIITSKEFISPKNIKEVNIAKQKHKYAGKAYTEQKDKKKAKLIEKPKIKKYIEAEVKEYKPEVKKLEPKKYIPDMKEIKYEAKEFKQTEEKPKKVKYIAETIEKNIPENKIIKTEVKTELPAPEKEEIAPKEKKGYSIKELNKDNIQKFKFAFSDIIENNMTGKGLSKENYAKMIDVLKSLKLYIKAYPEYRKIFYDLLKKIDGESFNLYEVLSAEEYKKFRKMLNKNLNAAAEKSYISGTNTEIDF